jgi:hypothetical protein
MKKILIVKDINTKVSFFDHYMILKDINNLEHIISYKHIKKMFVPDSFKITTKEYGNLFAYAIPLLFYKNLEDIANENL